MKISIKELNKDHELILAGKEMVRAHNKFDTLKPAVDFVAEKYPDIDPDFLISLWIGINCKWIEQN